METCFCVPKGTDITVVQEEYPDLYEDEGWDDHQRYYIGKNADEDDEEEGYEPWMGHDEAVEFCGFAEGAVEEGNCLIEGNGGWAQGMISRRDFKRLAISANEKREYKRVSDLYWAAYKRGQAAALSPSNVQSTHRHQRERASISTKRPNPRRPPRTVRLVTVAVSRLVRLFFLPSTWLG